MRSFNVSLLLLSLFLFLLLIFLSSHHHHHRRRIVLQLITFLFLARLGLSLPNQPSHGRLGSRDTTVHGNALFRVRFTRTLNTPSHHALSMGAQALPSCDSELSTSADG